HGDIGQNRTRKMFTVTTSSASPRERSLFLGMVKSLQRLLRVMPYYPQHSIVRNAGVNHDEPLNHSTRARAEWFNGSEPAEWFNGSEPESFKTFSSSGLSSFSACTVRPLSILPEVIM